jgi:hypothetical protein
MYGLAWKGQLLSNWKLPVPLKLYYHILGKIDNGQIYLISHLLLNLFKFVCFLYLRWYM